MQQKYYRLTVQESLEKLDSSPSEGLSDSQVKNKRDRYGSNQIPKSSGIEVLQLIFDQFENPLVWILFAAGILIFLVGDYPSSLMEAGFIWGVILINTFFGFWQDYKASRVLKSLEEYDQPEVLVLRDGKKVTVSQNKLVMGDIVLLKSGDKVPVDGRLIETNDLSISEAMLTGESEAVKKSTQEIEEKKSIFDRKNMVYRGTAVEEGSAKMLVTAVGKQTEIGRISALIQTAQLKDSPLQRKMKKFVKTLAAIMVVLTALLMVIGLIQGRDFLTMFETSLAIVIGGIPEALPIVTALILAIGMKRLAEKKGVVRKLSSVETLGAATVICCDKTITLTTGKMKAILFSKDTQEYDLDKTSDIQQIEADLKLLGLVNSGTVENPGETLDEIKIIGDPTDRAITRLVYETGFYVDSISYENQKFTDYELVKTIEFDSKRGYQSRIYKHQGEFLQVFLGMPEKLIDFGSRENKDKFQDKNIQLTQQGYRVICLAARTFADKAKIESVDNLEIHGLIALQDPLREGVKESLNQAQQAGLRVVMITGDHKNTALAIADQLDMQVEEDEVLLGEEVEQMDFEEFAKQIDRYKVYARILPENKMKIVKAWQEQGEVVAMTGDGINDGPAIKQADIGIAVGSGTEVAKQSADLVLLNDGFHIIVEAIRQGRVILDNIRKAASYVLADGLASIVLVGMSVLLKLPLPILWQQILWNNLVEDTFPNIAFAFEPAEKGILNRSPEDKDAQLLTPSMKKLILIVGLLDQVLTFGLFVLLLNLGHSLDYARTMVFGSLVMDTAFVIYSFKNLHKNIWEYSLFNNKHLLASSIVVFLGFAAALYAPFISSLLGTVPLSLSDWGIQVLISLGAVVLTEAGKFVFIKRKFSQKD